MPGGLLRRKSLALLIACVFRFVLFSFQRLDAVSPRFIPGNRLPGTSGGSNARPYTPAGDPVPVDEPLFQDGSSRVKAAWSQMKPHYPVTNMLPLPTSQPSHLPKLQHDFAPESPSERELRLQRRDAVKAAMKRCWSSYRRLAWKSDELAPVSGKKLNPFGGWGATLVDSLDTLWIMDMKDEFYEAVIAATTIDFESVGEDLINVFETNIRYLGGFLGAYELSGDRRLLTKAREVGEMLYVAFDTPNRMPITRWDARAAAQGKKQQAPEHVLIAELGTFALEFIRLSMITGDPKWFDAVQRITGALRASQNTTLVPGLWPVVVNPRKEDFSSHPDYTLGAMADSLFEYLPKTHALMGGLLPEYREMYEVAMDTAIRENLFRPMVPDNADILISGIVTVRKKDDGSRTIYLKPEAQHLVCFAGGMLLLGGKLVGNDTHVDKGTKITNGCVWTYNATPSGIMPENFFMLPCKESQNDSDDKDCPWDPERWKRAVLLKAGLDPEKDGDKTDAIIEEKHLPQGIIAIEDGEYHLRPEAIESVFILYRLTGCKDLLDTAWQMWQAIEENTRTPLANSGLVDVTAPRGKSAKLDRMESFWIGETLKYFYLMFSEPDLISLDDYVLNTEAHPLKRLRPLTAE